MIVLPSAYLPSISYFSHLMGAGGECVVDLGEHYIKRTERNRARIMTAQGVMDLTIPVRNANKARQAMSTMLIDNSKRWQHQHYMAILSAYKSSPYFDHFAPYIEPLYRKQWDRLVDFNEAMMSVMMRLLRLDKEALYTLSTSYIEPLDGVLDLRVKGSGEHGFEAKEYTQVFSDRLAFEPNMSMLDLLFCEGTIALDYVSVIHR